MVGKLANSPDLFQSFYEYSNLLINAEKKPLDRHQESFQTWSDFAMLCMPMGLWALSACHIAAEAHCESFKYIFVWTVGKVEFFAIGTLRSTSSSTDSPRRLRVKHLKNITRHILNLALLFGKLFPIEGICIGAKSSLTACKHSIATCLAACPRGFRFLQFKIFGFEDVHVPNQILDHFDHPSWNCPSYCIYVLQVFRPDWKH